MLWPLDALFYSLEQLLLAGALIASAALCGGVGLALALRLLRLRWTWSAVLLPPTVLATSWYLPLALSAVGVCLVGCMAGMVWHTLDMTAGADRAELARSRVGALEVVLRLVERLQEEQEERSPGRDEQRRRGRGRGWLRGGYLEVGRDERGWSVSIPAGDAASGSHTLMVGATGSGKTCGQAWIACRLIEHGRAAVAVDPKGDRMLREELRAAAQRAGVEFLEWTPTGPLAYNPYARGTPTEVADKALAGERFTEIHYLRQGQRYLGHAVRAMRAARIPVTPASLMEHMDPDELERTARSIPDTAGVASDSAPVREIARSARAEEAHRVYAYLDSLTDRQRRDLSGVRDRLSILVESDVGPWLDPLSADGDAGAGSLRPECADREVDATAGTGGLAGAGTIDLAAAVRARAVVYFDLDADRRPLLAQMLGAAIVSDLGTLAAELREERFAGQGTPADGCSAQRGMPAGERPDPIPAIVLIDEFAAIAARQVGAVCSRARDAGMSLLLATQELADLELPGTETLRKQIQGSVESMIAYRQSNPESAQLVADFAGTRPAWVFTQQTRLHLFGNLPRRRGFRRRGREHSIHPSRIQRLGTGEAAVISLRGDQPPAIARMHHPEEARVNTPRSP